MLALMINNRREIKYFDLDYMRNWDYFLPELPKPAAPRVVADNSST